MARQIFSQNYYGGNQNKVLQALAEGDAHKVYETIKKFPAQEKNPVEDNKRLITMGEAYKALAELLIFSDKKETPTGVLEEIAKQNQGSNL